jgi:hypothetical protein
MENSGRDKMQDKLFFIETNGVPCIMASLIPGHYINILGEQINDLALALITPLHPYYNHNRHKSLQINK